MGYIGDLVVKLGKFLGFGQLLGRHAGQAHLELDEWDDAGQVAIARAFTIAVDRALDMGGAGDQAGDAIGHTEPAVIVGVDTNRDFELAAFRFAVPGHVRVLSAPVRIPSADSFFTRLFFPSPRFHCFLLFVL